MSAFRRVFFGYRWISIFLFLIRNYYSSDDQGNKVLLGLAKSLIISSIGRGGIEFLIESTIICDSDFRCISKPFN